MNDENNKIKKLLSDLPIRNKSNFSKAPPHDGANEGHQKSANMTVRQTADRSHDYDVMKQFFPCQKMKFLFPKIFEKRNSLLRRHQFGCLHPVVHVHPKKICRK